MAASTSHVMAATSCALQGSSDSGSSERRSLHVVIATPSFPPAIGGVARVAERQAAYLVQCGHRVTVITAGTASTARNPVGPDGIPNIIRLPVRAGRFPFYAAGDALGMPQPAVRAQYQQLLVQSSPDVFITHCWQAWNTDWAIDTCEQLRFPICLYSHGASVNDTSGRTGWLRWLRWRPYAWARMPRTLRRIARLIVLDDQVDRNRFYDAMLARALSTPLAVVPNCASPDLLGASPWQPDEVKTPHLALSVGQYSAEKNPGQVLEAFLRGAPAGWTLVICGSQANAHLRALERRYAAYQRRGATPPVIFASGLAPEQLMGLYRRADLFLVASKTECQPLVLLDAMAAGVPFVSTDVGCVRSFAGGLVAQDANEFEAHATALMNDQRRRALLGAAGRRMHATRYDCPVTMSHFESVLLNTAASWGVQHG